MSDISLPHCPKCGRVEYDCSCPCRDWVDIPWAFIAIHYVGGPADGRVMWLPRANVQDIVNCQQDGFYRVPACCAPGGKLAIYESNGPCDASDIAMTGEITIEFTMWIDDFLRKLEL